MRRKPVLYSIMLILMCAFMLGGCGIKKLSGKFKNESNKKEYYVFSGESKVDYHNGGTVIHGTYLIEDSSLTEDGTILIHFDEEECSAIGIDPMSVLFVKNRHTIYMPFGTTFSKPGPIKQFIKWSLIISIVYGVIAWIYKKTTGKDLNEEIEKLSDDQ